MPADSEGSEPVQVKQHNGQIDAHKTPHSLGRLNHGAISLFKSTGSTANFKVTAPKCILLYIPYHIIMEKTYRETTAADFSDHFRTE